MRRIASWTAFLTWIYSWAYFRGIRSDMEGPLPGLLVASMGAVTTLLIGAAISGWMKLRLWPLVTVASALLFIVIAIWAQQEVMTSALEAIGSSKNGALSDAVTAMLRQRSLFGLIVLAAGPTLMVLSGITGAVKMRGEL